jgi:radical SAM protein with 4Fe4S-binding SPASM domain
MVGESKELFVTSPYLLNNGDGTFINLIRNTRQELEDSMVALLLNLPPVFTFQQFKSSIDHEFDRYIDFFEELRRKEIVIKASEKTSKYRIESVNIEICSHCNGRCSFCPVGFDPLPKKLMSNVNFEQIINRIPIGEIDWISLNHYNEPLLDPNFIEKVCILKKYGFKLRLFTNGVLLNQKKIDALFAIGNVELIVVNLPTLDPNKYSQLMGMSYKPAIMKQLLYLVEKEFPTEVCINNSHEEALKTKNDLEYFFKQNNSHLPRMIINRTHDRAGLLESGEFLLKSKASTYGCRRFFSQLNINVNGEVFMCCQDYYQESIFGNLLEQDLKTILTNESASKLRKMIFGMDSSDADFICDKCTEAHTIKFDAQKMLSDPS